MQKCVKLNGSSWVTEKAFFEEVSEARYFSVHRVRSHFGSTTQSARSVFALPSCTLMATAIDEATIVQAIMHGLASGGATRQVVTTAASAILRTHRGDQRGDGLHLPMQEKLKAVHKISSGTRLASRR